MPHKAQHGTQVKLNEKHLVEVSVLYKLGENILSSLPKQCSFAPLYPEYTWYIDDLCSEAQTLHSPRGFLSPEMLSEPAKLK